MSFNTAYPKVQKAFFQYMNMELAGDQTAEDAVLYEWIDELIDECFAEAESYCGQPLRTSVSTYTFTHLQARHGLKSEHRWKYIPMNANTSLNGLQWREDEFSTYANLPVQNYQFSTDNGHNFIIYRNVNSGQFRATLSTGFTDEFMPYSIVQGIVEMVAWKYKHSSNGGNWFGLSSISTGGAGAQTSSAIVSEIDWKKYFAKYQIATV